MFCGKCGYELKEKEKFCPKCGNEVMKSEAPKRQKNKQNKGKHWKKAVVIIAILCIATGVGIGWGAYQKHVNQYYAVVGSGGKYGYINLQGKEVIPLQYSSAEDFQHNRRAVVGIVTGTYDDGSEEDSYGLIDTEGNELTEFKYSNIDKFQENGLARATVEIQKLETEDENGYGYIDEDGNEVIECKYSYIGEFSDSGIVYAETEDYALFLNEQGEELFGRHYESGGDFASNGLAPVEEDGTWGYINEYGSVVIPFQYDEAMEFGDNGLAPVRIGERWGYIDENGKMVIPVQFEHVSGTFSDGVAVVYTGTNLFNYMYGFIDENGEFVSDGYEYEIMENFGESIDQGISEVVKNGKWGWINTKGEVLLPFEYQMILDQYQSLDGTITCIGYLEDTDGEGNYNLGKPEMIDGKGNIIFSYEDYVEMLSGSSYDQEFIDFYGFLRPYGDNGWAVCGDSYHTYWFDKDKNVHLQSTLYTSAGMFIEVK